MTLTAVLLTKNEERHIEGALVSVAAIAERHVVVDGASVVRTDDLARITGANVL